MANDGSARVRHPSSSIFIFHLHLPSSSSIFIFHLHSPSSSSIRDPHLPSSSPIFILRLHLPPAIRPPAPARAPTPSPRLRQRLAQLRQQRLDAGPRVVALLPLDRERLDREIAAIAPVAGDLDDPLQVGLRAV